MPEQPDIQGLRRGADYANVVWSAKPRRRVQKLTALLRLAPIESVAITIPTTSDRRARRLIRARALLMRIRTKKTTTAKMKRRDERRNRPNSGARPDLPPSFRAVNVSRMTLPAVHGMAPHGERWQSADHRWRA
jgi:hypothetical protein